mgnify:CR=1 FL=1
MGYRMDMEQMLIRENDSVLHAMELLDSIATKVLFVEKDRKLLAALTDGDIRRWILSKGDLRAEVCKAANYHPKYLRNADREEAFRFMRKNAIEAVPILDSHNCITNVICRDGKDSRIRKEKINIPVVMMAGGKGKRLYPYTKILPKPLIPVGEIPIAEHIINRFHEFGCHEFYLILNHKKNMIKAYFNEIEKDYDVHYVDETVPLGTGGGLSLLKGQINQTFILTNCDILIKEDFAKIYKHHKEKHHMITMVCSLKNFQIPYGVIEIGKTGEIEKMKEKPNLSFFTNTGCYIVEPEVIDGMEENTEIGFPDVIEHAKQQGMKVGVYPIGENAWLDMGQLDELENMKRVLVLE